MTKDDTCGVEGCQKQRYGRWCPMHANRIKRHGSPDIVLKKGPKPGSNWWSDNPSYLTVPSASTRFEETLRPTHALADHPLRSGPTPGHASLANGCHTARIWTNTKHSACLATRPRTCRTSRKWSSTMTEQTTEETPLALNPTLKRTAFSLTINTYDVENLRESIDLMSVMMGRHGLGAFFIVATDPDTGEQWVVHDNDYIIPMAEWEARAAEIDAEEIEDTALEEAVQNIVDKKLSGEGQEVLGD